MNAQVGPRVCRCVLELPRRKHGRLPTAVVDPLVQVGTKECAHHVAQRTLIGRKVEVPHLLCELNAKGRILQTPRVTEWLKPSLAHGVATPHRSYDQNLIGLSLNGLSSSIGTQSGSGGSTCESNQAGTG